MDGMKKPDETAVMQESHWIIEEKKVNVNIHRGSICLDLLITIIQ